MRIGRKTVVAAMLLLSCGLAGCELSEGDSAATSDVSGTWSYSDTTGAQSTWALVQSDDDTIAGAGTDGETIHGAVNGDTITVSVTYSSDTTANLAGTVSGDTISGSVSNSVSGDGSWTAVRTN